MKPTLLLALLLGAGSMSLSACAAYPPYDEPASAELYQYTPPPMEAPPPAPARPSERALAAAQNIREAADPSSAIDAYAKAQAVFGDNPVLLDSYVKRMLDFGMPEMADTQAQELARRDPNNGVAWAVAAYMSARRGQMPAAISQISAAAKNAPDDPFVARTAAQLVAWYDVQADQSRLDERSKQSIAALRQNLQNNKGYADAYGRARDFYQRDRQANATQPSGAAPSPADGSAGLPPDQQVGPDRAGPLAGGGAALPNDRPPAVVEQTDTVYVPPPVYSYTYNTYYTDPFYSPYPTFGYWQPWWPSAYCPTWWWPTFGSVVFLGDDSHHRHHFDRDDFRRWDGRRWDGDRFARTRDGDRAFAGSNARRYSSLAANRRGDLRTDTFARAGVGNNIGSNSARNDRVVAAPGRTANTNLRVETGRSQVMPPRIGDRTAVSDRSGPSRTFEGRTFSSPRTFSDTPRMSVMPSSPPVRSGPPMHSAPAGGGMRGGGGGGARGGGGGGRGR